MKYKTPKPKKFLVTNYTLAKLKVYVQLT